jgi:hypothetical protein
MDSADSTQRSPSPSSIISPPSRTHRNPSTGTTNAALRGGQGGPEPPTGLSTFRPINWRGGETQEQNPRAPSLRTMVDVFEDAPSHGGTIADGHSPPPVYSRRPAFSQQHQGTQHHDNPPLAHPLPRRPSQPSWMPPPASPTQPALPPPSPSPSSSSPTTTTDTHLAAPQHYLVRTTTVTTPTTTTTTTTTITTTTFTHHPTDPLYSSGNTTENASLPAYSPPPRPANPSPNRALGNRRP